MKTSMRFDAVITHLEHEAGRKLDANETLFLQRQLESVESTLFETKQRELKYRQYIPVSNRDNPGAETITYRLLTKVGMARVIASGADDLPSADAFVQEFTARVKSIGTSFRFTTQELRAAAMNNVSLENTKSAAARRAMHEKEADIAWNGDSVNALVGLLTHPNITSMASPAGAGGTVWSLKTPDEIIADIGAMVTKVRSQSKGVHEADTLLLPIDQYNLIAQTPRATNSDTTILEFILQNNAFGLTTIDWLSVELDLAFTGGTEDGAICYERSAEVLENRIPMEMMVHPAQPKGLNFEFPVESRNGGVVVRFPLGIVFMTGI